MLATLAFLCGRFPFTWPSSLYFTYLLPSCAPEPRLQHSGVALPTSLPYASVVLLEFTRGGGKYMWKALALFLMKPLLARQTARTRSGSGSSTVVSWNLLVSDIIFFAAT